ncbi:hypothetical protein LJC63_09500 [Ruminococcaceae bacterium OttesenSCG-928-L11]|nr:hypothetical protein [Ruminococcaceae bacterium OttesenSCG-928-L11]
MTWTSKQILPDNLILELKEAQVAEGLSAPFWPVVARYNLDYAVMSEKFVTGPVESEYWYDLKSYFDEVKMKIVIGAESPDSFDKWVEYFYANGGQEVVDEVNQLNS